MGIIKAWVAEHTGLPSFYTTGNGRITADVGEHLSRLVAMVDGEALVSDPGAPQGEPVTYHFGAESVVLRRSGQAATSAAHQFITDVSGSLIAGVKLLGSDPREYATDAEIFTSALGRHIPRFPLGQPPATGTLEVSTVGVGTRVLRELVRSQVPLWVIHDQASCQIPGCDIEGSRLIVAHRMSEARSPRRDVAQRNWQVQYSRVPDALGVGGVQSPTGCPVVTWGQWESWGEAHAPAGWQNWSAVEVARRVAGMPV